MVAKLRVPAEISDPRDTVPAVPAKVASLPFVQATLVAPSRQIAAAFVVAHSVPELVVEPPLAAAGDVASKGFHERVAAWRVPAASKTAAMGRDLEMRGVFFMAGVVSGI